MPKSNFIVRGGADFSGINNSFKKLQKDMKGYQSTLGKTLKGIGVILGGLITGKLIKDSTAMAMGVESALDNISRNMGASSAAFNNWVENQSKALGMAKADAYQYGSTFSNLLSSFTSGTKETSDQTQELMKAAAIISSKTGRTYDDVANRIRSGMLGSTEAIEDLGVYTQVSMLESTEAFKKFANGKSWSQLSFQTQQQIRLAAILEQTYARYGDTLADTTQTRQAMFIASLKNIQLLLGQAFLPIYNAVLPALTAMANAVERVVNVMAQFSQALFGKEQKAKETQAQAAAMGDLGDATEKAGKQAKGALMGFDEINQLADNSSAAGVGDPDNLASISGNVDPMPINFETNAPEVSEKVQKMADTVKKSMTDIKDTVLQNKDLIVSGLAGIVSGLAAFEIISNWGAIVAGVKGILAGLGATIAGVSAPVVAVAALIGILIANLVSLWQTDEVFRDSVIEVWTQIKEFFIKVTKDMLQIVNDTWDKHGKALLDNLKETIGGIKTAIKSVWEGFLKPIITKELEMLDWLWEKHLKGLVKQIGEFVMKCITGALEIWNGFIAPVVGWMVNIFGPIVVEVVKTAIDTFGSLLAGVIDVGKGLFKTLGGIIDFIVGVFTGDWKKAWGGVKDIFKGVFDSLVGIVKVPLNLIIGAVNAMIRGLNKISIDVPDWVAKITPGLKVGDKWGFSIEEITPLARGGIITSPTLAMVGEQGPEAVVPLENTAFVDAIATAVGNAVLGAMQFSTTGSNDNREVVLSIDGTKLGRALLPKLNQESERLGYKSILQTT